MHFNATQVLVVQKSSGIGKLSDLSAGRIAVQESTSGEVYASDYASSSTQIVQFKNTQDVNVALSGGTLGKSGCHAVGQR